MARLVPSDIGRLELAGGHRPELQTLRDLGEIDFAVVNRAGRVLLIEQKNGLPGGVVKPVGDQVRRGLEGVREKFKVVHAGHANLHLDYLVYCPDYRVVRLNAAALDASRVVDASARGRLAERIAELLGAGTAAADGWLESHTGGMPWRPGIFR